MRVLGAHTHLRRLWTIAASGVLLLPLAAFSASSSQPPDKVPTPRTAPQIEQDERDAATQLGQNELDAAAESVDALTSKDIENYFAVGIDLAAQSVVVWRKGGAAGLSLATKGAHTELALGSSLQYRDSLFSLAELRAVQNSIISGFSGLTTIGIYIQLIGPLVTGGPLVVLYSPAGLAPSMEILTNLGITKNWPQGLLDGSVKFEAGDVAPFD